jgi:hypothetical protein
MNKNEIRFLRDRVHNLKEKIEIAQNCLDSVLDSLNESDDFMQLIDFYYKNTK